jgi:hypothetical protein
MGRAAIVIRDERRDRDAIDLQTPRQAPLGERLARSPQELIEAREHEEPGSPGSSS